MSATRRVVQLPALVFVLMLVGLATFFGQGLRMARDRTARMQPHRAAATLRLPAVDTVEFSRAGQRFLVVELGPPLAGKIGLFHAFPERVVPRWVEPATAQRGPLVIPLEGLEPGLYQLVELPPDARAEPQEMDAPSPNSRVLGEFRLLP